MGPKGTTQSHSGAEMGNYNENNSGHHWLCWDLKASQ